MGRSTPNLDPFGQPPQPQPQIFREGSVSIIIDGADAVARVPILGYPSSDLLIPLGEVVLTMLPSTAKFTRTSDGLVFTNPVLSFDTINSGPDDHVFFRFLGATSNLGTFEIDAYDPAVRGKTGAWMQPLLHTQTV